MRVVLTYLASTIERRRLNPRPRRADVGAFPAVCYMW
jgi:hypothetical protein